MPAVENADMSNLTDLELRAHLEAISVTRRAIAADHAQRVQPLLDRRARLMAEVGKLDGEIAWEGIQRQDGERQCDRDVQAVQAELRQRVVPSAVVDDAYGVVDQHAVDVLLDQMLSGKLKRNDVVGGPPELSDACERFDALEVEAIAWVRQVAQVRSATGRTPTMPESLERFDLEVLKDIARRHGVLL